MKHFRGLPIILFSVLFAALGHDQARAAIPQLLHYQGRMIVGGTNYTGTGQFKFALISGEMNTNITASARANVSLLDGSITSITILDGGTGYRSAPDVTISSLFGGRGATAEATVENGSVTKISMVTGGSGYPRFGTRVSIEPPPPAFITDTFWSNDETSTLAGEPSASVAIEVKNGLYSVLLGNAALPNMSIIPTSVFENSPVFLRIWFDDGATGFQPLEPDQQIAAVGYAMMSANVPDGLIDETKLANGAVTTEKLANDAVTSAQLANDAVTADKLANDAVTADKLAAEAVTGAAIAPASIGGGSLMDGTVGSAALADSLGLGGPGLNGRLEVYSTTAQTPAVVLDGSSAMTTYGSDGLPQIELFGTSWGVLELNNSRPENRTAARLSANNDSGGELRLYNTNGITKALVRGLNSGGDVWLYSEDGSVGLLLDGDVGPGYGYVSVRDTGGNPVVELAGQNEDTNQGGQILVNDADGDRTVALDGRTSATRGGALRLYQDDGVTLGATLEGETGNGSGGALRLRNSAGDQRVYLTGDSGEGGYLLLDQADGGNGVLIDGESGGAGLIQVYNAVGAPRVVIDGEDADGGGEISIRDDSGTETVQILGAETTSSGGEIKLYQADGTLAVELDGEAGNGNGGWLRLWSGDGSTAITLDADDSTGVGRVTTQVLQITGGSDLSEQFDVKPADQELEPGMLVCIDPDHPGRLIMSTKAYDRTAAGVISGANGVNTGMIMGQEGSVANGKHPVALTGRVYCMVDADQNGPVQPGDLITTSDSPGHGMKVTDHARAQGAIIGKAMTRLESGRGLVLVLVSLQ